MPNFSQLKPLLSIVFGKYIPLLWAAIWSKLLFLTFSRPLRQNSIVLFGHNFDGNLKAFSSYLSKTGTFKVYFMTDVKKVYIQNRGKLSVPVLYAGNVKDLRIAANSSAIITSHGPISLRWWLSSSHRPAFIDVWHGVGFKGRIQKAIGQMKRYDALFAPSSHVREFYIESGVHPDKVVVTGFARTDALLSTPTLDEKQALRVAYGLRPNEGRKIALFAPTWNDRYPDRILPFDMPNEEAFTFLDRLGEQNDTLVLLRPHPHTVINLKQENFTHLQLTSSMQYPDTESLLRIVDILITDWSSIFAEFMTLERPIVFIDSIPSFGSHLAPLTADDRPGAIVKNPKEFAASFSLASTLPHVYLEKHKATIQRVKERAWSNTLDTQSSRRYLNALERVLTVTDDNISDTPENHVY